LIAIASNTELIVIPVGFKNLAIGHKPKLERKSWTKSALEKHLD
jgi:hypothetical protein